jgi:hypothetical protein
VQYATIAWLCLAHAAFSNGNANRENNPARVEKRSDLFGVFEGTKKICRIWKNDFLFPFAHAIKFSPAVEIGNGALDCW